MSDPIDFPDRLCHRKNGHTVNELIEAIHETTHLLVNDIRRVTMGLNYSETGLSARGYDNSHADAQVFVQESEGVAQLHRLLERAQAYLPKK